jgi:hypothetical protein
MQSAASITRFLSHASEHHKPGHRRRRTPISPIACRTQECRKKSRFQEHPRLVSPLTLAGECDASTIVGFSGRAAGQSEGTLPVRPRSQKRYDFSVFRGPVSNGWFFGTSHLSHAFCGIDGRRCDRRALLDCFCSKKRDDLMGRDQAKLLTFRDGAAKRRHQPRRCIANGQPARLLECEAASC